MNDPAASGHRSGARSGSRSGSRSGRRSKRGRRTLLATAGTLAVVAITLLALGVSQQESEPARNASGTPPSAPGNPQAGGSAASGEPPPAGEAGGGSGSGKDSGKEVDVPRHPPLKASTPARIKIPALRVSAGLEKLGLGTGGAMDTPRDPAKAGWYTPGPAPGAQGPSVIAGHVTWNGEPSVFFRLASLKAGDRIDVTRRDGRTAVFTVQRIARYAKDRFPTVEVYRNLDHAGLRLITCGGEYSKSDHRYADNIVVYAALSDSK
ncbi:class F sortase [Streptomyces sp. H27-D2]|uniref:class F sortase n=1 Tax=Streptomyces sp. H27-D2 TaxID=3046304 RepID=UPI002DBD3DCF|nr:class F sortase [Streptomyces sp. H27-D2]MEC4015311.1 class F sortase [Streptomyces sp. H27-D2]